MIFIMCRERKLCVREEELSVCGGGFFNVVWSKYTRPNLVSFCRVVNKNRDSECLKKEHLKIVVFFLAMPLRHFHHSGIGPPRPCHIRLRNYTLCVVLHISTSLFYYT